MNSLKATCTSYLIGSKGNRRARWQFSLEREAACKSKEKSNEHVKIVDRGKWQLLGSRVRRSYFNGFCHIFNDCGWTLKDQFLLHWYFACYKDLTPERKLINNIKFELISFLKIFLNLQNVFVLGGLFNNFDNVKTTFSNYSCGNVIKRAFIKPPCAIDLCSTAFHQLITRLRSTA